MYYEGYIYLIHVREFKIQGKPIYKIGRTNDIIRRFSQYPKNSDLLFVMPVKNTVQYETILINTFIRDFNHKKEYGKEYFEGDSMKMILTISRICSKLTNTCKDMASQTCDPLDIDCKGSNRINPFLAFALSN